MLSSCSQTGVKRISPDCDLDCNMSFNYIQSDFSAHIKTDENGNLTADIQSPENLKGISVVCRSDGVTAECGDVKTDCADGYYPFKELYNTIKCIRESEPASAEEINGEYSFVYKDNSSQYTAVTDESGKIKYVSTPMCKFKVAVGM